MFSHTSFDEWVPAMNTKEQAERLLSQLKVAPPKVVLWDHHRHAADPVERWVQENYIPLLETGMLTIGVYRGNRLDGSRTAMQATPTEILLN